MSLDRFPISRRTLLRGAGAAVALPWLEAMAPRRLRANETSATPKRLAVLYMPNGTNQDNWTPTGSGSNFRLSKTLSPLSDLQNDIVVVTNLWNQNSDSGDGHYVKTSGFLTGTTIHKTIGVDLNANGISLDQLYSQRVGHQTPLPSLELACEPVRTGVDKAVGYTRVYGAHIAWRSPTSPLAREINPQLVYERLMNAGNRSSSSAERDTALLDLVLEDARRVRQQLGMTDRRKMDEYLESVRSLEQRLARLAKDGGNNWAPRSDLDAHQKPADMPEEKPELHAQRVELMLDMIAMAFQTDITRVSTFMFGNSVSNINFSFLDGVEEAHHSLSHHSGDAEALHQYQLIGQWHIEQYSRLLRKLKNMKEGEGSVLDNSLILFGSSLRDGNAHDPHNLPVVVAGNCGGRVRTGQHLIYAKDSPLTNLYVSMLDALGTPVERFADSTGYLPGVLA